MGGPDENHLLVLISGGFSLQPLEAGFLNPWPEIEVRPQQ